MSGAPCVFIVDDDPSARNGLVRLLRAAGYDVQAFASGKELLETLDPDAFGCLVLDARMPGISGDELHQKLSGHHVQRPIIFVTVDDNPETREKAQKMKAFAFFRKPVDGAALLDAVSWALDSVERTERSERQ
jgi:FixJ family two-component response regulator